jgi:hypothetical protein
LPKLFPRDAINGDANVRHFGAAVQTRILVPHGASFAPSTIQLEAVQYRAIGASHVQAIELGGFLVLDVDAWRKQHLLLPGIDNCHTLVLVAAKLAAASFLD